MKAVELEKAYAPKSFEDRIYNQWKESGAFKPKEGTGNPYVIVIPPPNVTGVLHLGHGLNITLQDIVIRFHRMRGEPVLWLPGTDHAGIATQNVVEKKLKEKGISRHDLGREKFVEETWKVKREHHAIISRQLARIGASVDWSRERFTLDEGLSRAVREVFVTLYERDLLYKGNYLVNWCCSCGTALSDDEVDHEERAGKMYHLRYPCVDGDGSVEIATTRPETLLGDTAVAVHPEDPRYAALLGRELVLPLTGRNIPVIADTYVDREFGTGAVKITPAHDPNDWEVAKRHDLPVISILRPDGRLNDAAPEKYRDLTVAEAREAVLADLKAGGFYIKEEEITHAVGHCYRCHTVIEPFLSEQWFVRMKPLADKALAAWRGGDIIFYPRKWENTYQHWLENIRDWCVSRQLWWGHRIPAWYCKKCDKTSVSRTDLAVCPHCGSAEIEQDPDVLDTWFSSWLWPFSTLGWPETLPNGELLGGEGGSDFQRFYPTTALVTAYDIIFFWVSRMIMAGLEFTGKAPFRDIYIHGLIRDKQGRKMSKSLGNGLDPLQLVDEYGADALKFTLAFMCAQGQDILIDEGSFKLGSKFANKVWNAARFILMNLEGRNVVKDPSLLPVDRWIRSRLGTAARAITGAFLSYRYNDAAQIAYEYFWSDFCDWYVEAAKLSMREGDDAEKDRAATVLLEVLAESLRLLHPLLPFVTEEIYGKLPYKGADGDAGLLINAPYPEYDECRADPRAEADFAFIQELVTLVRTLRSECTLTPDKKVRVLVRTAGADRAAFLRENAGLVKLLAGMGELEVEGGGPEFAAKSVVEGDIARRQGSIGLVGSGFEAFVFIAGAVDLAFLKQKFAKDLAKDSKFITGLQTKLSNENFLKNAPPELAAQERVKLEEALKRTAKLESYIKDLL
ncbi:MAG: valine--tRNA ligase [Treponema sp.]|jgi:valyl-tRNA synthetase|nr:valine--tRNA ligase [Treponema sp.]